jgi:hypothetical protein
VCGDPLIALRVGVAGRNGPAGMGSAKRRAVIGGCSEGRAQRLPQVLLLGLICEEADASIEYGELSFLEVLATIRRNDELVSKAVRA